MSAILVANKILDAARNKGKALTPLQLMKLAYIAHGFHLQQTKEPLFNEDVEAWQYGPVIPSIYHAAKIFGREPISATSLPAPLLASQRAPKPFAVQLIEGVVEAYGHLSGPALSNLTHRPGSPWYRTWRPGIRNLKIPNDLIKSHYDDVVRNRVLDSA